MTDHFKANLEQCTLCRVFRYSHSRYQPTTNTSWWLTVSYVAHLVRDLSGLLTTRFILDGVMRLWRFNSPGFVNVIMLQILIHFRSGALRCADDSCLFVTGASLGHLVSPGVGKPLTDTLSWTYPGAEHTFLLPTPLSCSCINLQCLSLNCRRQRLLEIPQISPSLLPILNFNRLLIYLSVTLAVILDGLSWSPCAGKRLLPMDLPSKQASAHFPSTTSSEPG